MDFISILPLVVCAFTILVLRQTAIIGASVGFVAAIILILVSNSFNLPLNNAILALVVSVILTLSAAVVIIPGLYFNALLREHGTISALQHWVEKLNYNNEYKVILLLFGLLPAVESLTGFGVSLFLSIPIFFYLFPAQIAFRLSMLGMNIMPWGTLALATVVGSSLSGLSISTLGINTAIISSLVFPLFAMIAVYTVGGIKMLRKRLPSTLGLSFCLSFSLILMNSLHLTEVAGVISGFVVCLIGICVLPKTNTKNIQNYGKVFFIFFPYLLVLFLITLERVIPNVYDLLGNMIILYSGNVHFKLLTSPGIILLIVFSILYSIRPAPLPHRVLLSRAKSSCLSLFAFIFLAQIMLQSQMITTFANALLQWNNKLLLIISPIIGMFSGFITGSNLSGNALTMLVQSKIGNNLHHLATFSAAQNSGAGHAVFASIPIIVLILILAKDVCAENEYKMIKEHHLLRFGLLVILLTLPVIVFMTLINAYWL